MQYDGILFSRNLISPVRTTQSRGNARDLYCSFCMCPRTRAATRHGLFLEASRVRVDLLCGPCRDEFPCAESCCGPLRKLRGSPDAVDRHRRQILDGESHQPELDSGWRYFARRCDGDGRGVLPDDGAASVCAGCAMQYKLMVCMYSNVSERIGV
jgi:hypothetical protein